LLVTFWCIGGAKATAQTGVSGPIPLPPPPPEDFSDAGPYFTLGADFSDELVPGSAFSIEVGFFTSTDALPVNSYSLAFTSVAGLTLSGDGLLPPEGWTVTQQGNSFSFENVSGIDQAAGTDIDLGSVSFAIDPSLPVGDVLSVPSVSASSVLDDAGLPAVAFTLGEGYIGDITLVPEPQPAELLIMAILAWGLVSRGSARLVRKRQPVAANNLA
jgi:hypothetical protein